MKLVNSRSGLFVSSAIALLLPFSAAIAQSVEADQTADAQEKNDPDDIVVTATRQSQSVTKVPLSVAVFSEDDLRQRGVNNIDGIARLTPGVTIARGNTSPTGANVTIRGISSSTTGNLAGTTGVYIDDTPIQARGVGFSASTTFPVIFDLARVEVLRGPQGTLFGAGSEGGAIRFITPEPNFDGLKGNVRFEGNKVRSGGWGYEGGAAVGGPLIEDKLAFRASVYHRRDGGYIDRAPQPAYYIAEKNANWVESTVARVALAWKPTETLTITPSVSYQKQYANGTPAYWEAQSPGKNNYVNGAKVPEGFNDRFVLAALKVEADLGAMELISNTSYFNRESLGNNDYTFIQLAATTGKAPVSRPTSYLTPATSYFVSVVDQGNKQKNWAQEIRLQSSDPDARLNWVVGAFFTETKQFALQRTVIPTFELLYQQVLGRPFTSDPGWTGRGLLPGGIYIYSLVDAVDTQQAIFANVDFKITPELKLTAGVRYAHMKFKYDASYDGPANGPVAYLDSGSQSEKPFTPKVGISWQATPTFLLYGNVAKGFRQGGAQQRNPVNCTAELATLGYSSPPTTFESDHVWSYEVGAKGRLFGNAVTFDASAYQIDFVNVQRTIGLSSCARSFVANAGDARSRGFDLAIQTRPVPGFTLGGAVGFNRTRLKEDLLGGANAAGQRRLLISKDDYLNPREWTGNVNGEYSFAATGSLDAYIRGDFTFASKAKPGSINNPRVGTLSGVAGSVSTTYDPNIGSILYAGYGLMNARIGFRTDAFDISLFAQNLFDKQPLTSRTHNQTSVALPPNPLYMNTRLTPRTIGVTAQYSF